MSTNAPPPAGVERAFGDVMAERLRFVQDIALLAGPMRSPRRETENPMEELLSPSSLSTAGVLLLSVLAIEAGGYYMLKIVRGRASVTEFQTSFARAGHAHAGVLVTLGLVCQLFVDAADMSGVAELLARSGVPFAAILMSAGFFFSSMHKGATKPNGFIALVYAGTVSLALGAAFLGYGLITA